MAEAVVVQGKSKPKAPVPAPLVLDDTKIPKLAEVLPGGGISGVDYAYVLAQNIHHAKEAGYQLLPRGESFELEGTAVLIMWQGEEVKGSHSIPRLFLDTELDTLLGA